MQTKSFRLLATGSFLAEVVKDHLVNWQLGAFVQSLLPAYIV